MPDDTRLMKRPKNPLFFPHRVGLPKAIVKPEIGVTVAFLIFFTLFSILSPKFFAQINFAAMGTIASQVGIIAVGATMLMISGEFDLSVGSVFGMAAWIFGTLVNQGVDPILVAIITLGCCTLMGLLNGMITVKVGIPSFITTLGTMMLWRGMLYFVTEGYPLHIVVTGYTKSVLNSLGGYIGETPVRVTVIWFTITTVILAFILTRTRYGNWVYATGGNLAAARALGVNTDRVKLINFSLVGLLSGLSGTVNMARYLISQPVLGTGFELEAIAATVVGGTSLFGGYGTIIGTFIGTFLVAQISNGLILMGSPPFLYMALTGVIVILAVIFNTYVRKTARV